eukprot:548979-Prymnesium_polylepis.1
MPAAGCENGRHRPPRCPPTHECAREVARECVSQGSNGGAAVGSSHDMVPRRWWWWWEASAGAGAGAALSLMDVARAHGSSLGPNSIAWRR